jgi:hypothetical protein
MYVIETIIIIIRFNYDNLYRICIPYQFIIFFGVNYYDDVTKIQK